MGKRILCLCLAHRETVHHNIRDGKWVALAADTTAEYTRLRCTAQIWSRLWLTPQIRIAPKCFAKDRQVAHGASGFMPEIAKFHHGCLARIEAKAGVFCCSFYLSSSSHSGGQLSEDLVLDALQIQLHNPLCCDAGNICIAASILAEGMLTRSQRI